MELVLYLDFFLKYVTVEKKPFAPAANSVTFLFFRFPGGGPLKTSFEQIGDF